MAANSSTSRKRSAASSQSKLPDRAVFFVDRSLGKIKIADALRAAGVQVEVHDDHFATDAPDAVWLKAAGDKGWVVLTKDKNIRYRFGERQAVLASHVRAFVLAAGGLTGDEMAAIYVSALPAIQRFLKKHKGPFIVSVSRTGNLRPIALRS
jgi:predicted nuclease of predicted toxin-antitoxin system